MKTIEKVFKNIKFNLQLFNTNTTNDTELSAEMKTYYDDELIENATPLLIHAQFAQKKPIPKGKGKTIEFRKYEPLPKALVPLEEGVTPKGQKLQVGTIQATVKQYGAYVEISDMLDLTAIDNNLVEASTLLGHQSGITLDTLTREVMHQTTNVMVFDGTLSSRHQLQYDPANGIAHTLTPDVILRAEHHMKTGLATKIDGAFVAIIHPSVAYDIKSHKDFIDVVKYNDAQRIFEGEIGKFAGIRFIETTEAKITRGADLTEGARELTVLTAGTSATISVAEKITADDVAKLVGRLVLIDDACYTVVSAVAGEAGQATITVDEEVTVSENAIIYPGEGAAKGRAVYSTLVLGANAYGVSEVEGGGLENIVKQRGAGDDPLNQRATSGWKSTHAAEILVSDFLLRIDTVSNYDEDAN